MKTRKETLFKLCIQF